MIESSKAANEVYSPTSGVIEEVNPFIIDNPHAVGRDPIKEGVFPLFWAHQHDAHR